MHRILLGWLTPIHIHGVADDLEGIEADSDWQCNLKERCLFAQKCIEISNKKVCVLEINQERQADRNGDDHPYAAGRLPTVFLNQQTEKISKTDGYRHKYHIFRFAPGIEKKAGNK